MRLKSLSKNPDFIISVLILILAALLRLWDWPNQIGIGSDSSRDVLVGREMIAQGKLALIGSFSSAGPFTFGPWWYYLMAIPSLFFKGIFLAPWVFTTTISLASPIIAYWVGRKIDSRFLGTIMGILAAVSPTQIAFATILTQHLAAGVFSWLTLLLFIISFKSKKLIWIFALGLSMSLTANFHWQGLAMLSYSVIIFTLGSFKKAVIGLFVLAIGYLIPFIPMLVFDTQHNWFNIKGLVYYYKEGQYLLYFPNRWLTYAFEWWPNFWARVLGVPTFAATALIILAAFFGIRMTVLKKLHKELILIIIVFLLQVFILRNYRGERVASYVLFIEPMVILFSGWTITQLYKVNRIVAYLALNAICILAIVSLSNAKTVQREKTIPKIQTINTFSEYIFSNYPAPITLWDGDLGFLSARDVSQPLALKLDTKNKITQNAHPLGICYLQCPKDPPLTKDRIVAEINHFQLVDLKGLTIHYQTKEVKEGWTLMTPAATYYESVDFLDPPPSWWVKK